MTVDLAPTLALSRNGRGYETRRLDNLVDYNMVKNSVVFNKISEARRNLRACVRENGIENSERTRTRITNTTQHLNG